MAGLNHPHISIVTVYRNSQWQRIPSLLLCANDIVALMAGDIAPGKVQELVRGPSNNYPTGHIGLGSVDGAPSTAVNGIVSQGTGTVASVGIPSCKSVHGMGLGHVIESGKIVLDGGPTSNGTQDDSAVAASAGVDSDKPISSSHEIIHPAPVRISGNGSTLDTSAISLTIPDDDASNLVTIADQGEEVVTVDIEKSTASDAALTKEEGTDGIAVEKTSSDKYSIANTTVSALSSWVTTLTPKMGLSADSTGNLSKSLLGPSTTGVTDEKTSPPQPELQLQQQNTTVTSTPDIVLGSGRDVGSIGTIPAPSVIPPTPISVNPNPIPTPTSTTHHRSIASDNSELLTLSGMVL